MLKRIIIKRDREERIEEVLTRERERERERERDSAGPNPSRSSFRENKYDLSRRKPPKLFFAVSLASCSTSFRLLICLFVCVP